MELCDPVTSQYPCPCHDKNGHSTTIMSNVMSYSE